MAARFALTSNPWDDAIVDALKKPLAFLIWLIGLTIAVYVIKEATQQSIFASAAPLRDLGIVFALSWFLYPETHRPIRIGKYAGTYTLHLLCSPVVSDTSVVADHRSPSLLLAYSVYNTAHRFRISVAVCSCGHRGRGRRF